MRSKRRRTFVLLAVAVCLALALIWLLWAPRLPAPTVTSETSLVLPPAAATGLEVCWIESGRMVVGTASALLLRHPQGLVLLDAGNSVTIDEDFAGSSLGARLFVRALPGMLRPDWPISELLEALGAPPGKLKALLISHVHLDHLGGALQLPGVPIWTSEEELEFARKTRDAGGRHMVPRYADALAARGKPLTFESKPYVGFPRSADLFGDGSVVVVPMGGHTPGSIGVFITVDAAHRYFHVGDTVNELRQVSGRLGKRNLMAATDIDSAATGELVHRLHALSAQNPGLRLLPAHDRPAWLAAFGPKPTCVGPAAKN